MLTDTETDLSFALAPADALAWEAQPRALRGAHLFAYYLWLAAGAGWLMLLPAHWITGQLAWLLLLLPLVVVQIVLASLAMTLAARRRARRRIPAPTAARLVERGPTLLWQLGPSAAQEIAPAAIRQVRHTARHLFLDAARPGDRARHRLPHRTGRAGLRPAVGGPPRRGGLLKP